VVTTLLFCSADYFTGSKGNVLMIVISAVIYYNFYVNRIGVGRISLTVVSMFGLLLALLVFQGSVDKLEEIPLYFGEYVHTTAMFFERFPQFGGFRYGAISLSELWYYVPRGLYPGKPFEYGVLLIHERLFPGAAEQGSTPGILTWVGVYWDFGYAGLFVLGLACGACKRAVFDYFLKNRDRLLPFLFMIQFSLAPVLPFATPIISIVLLGTLMLLFRVRFGKGARRPLNGASS
jgi:hypothetical protein